MITERLDLVRFADQHLDVLHALWTDPVVRRYLWDDRVISRREAAEVIAHSRASFETEGFGFWLLIHRGYGEPAGFAGLRRFGDAGEVEILDGLAPSYWRQGLATEAARHLLRFTSGRGACAPSARDDWRTRRLLEALTLTALAVVDREAGGTPALPAPGMIGGLDDSLRR